MTKQNYLKLKKEMIKQLLLTGYGTCEVVATDDYYPKTAWTRCHISGKKTHCFKTELMFFDLDGNYMESVDFVYINVSDFIDYKNDDIEEVA